MDWNYWEKHENTPPVGLEPTIFGLEVQRVIHYATRAAQFNSRIGERTKSAVILLQKGTPTVGLEPTTTSLKGWRSTD